MLQFNFSLAFPGGANLALGVSNDGDDAIPILIAAKSEYAKMK
jgi:hypothetical protein